MKKGLGQFRPDGTLLGNTMPGPQLEGGMQASRRPSIWSLGLHSQLDCLGVVKVPVFFGGDEIEVRLGKTKGEEKRLLGLFFQMILQGGDRQLGIIAVPIGMVGNVSGLISRSMDQPARAFLTVFGKHLLLVCGPKFLVFGQSIAPRQPLPLNRTTIKGRLATPGMLVVRHAGMIDFSAVDGLVTIRDEVLGQSYDIRIKFSKVGRVLDYAYSIGPGSGHQAGSRRAANGLLTIGPIETQSISSKRIEYR